MNLQPQSPGERGIKRSRKEENIDETKTKKARIGTRQVHKLASLKPHELQNHPELISLIHRITENLHAFTSRELELIKKDLGSIKENILCIVREKALVIQEIDSILKSVPTNKITMKGKEEIGVPSLLEQQPPDIKREIFSYLPSQEAAYMLQILSQGFQHDASIEELRREFVNSIALNALNETLKARTPLSTLERSLTDTLRNSVQILNLKNTLCLTKYDLYYLAELFPNVHTLQLGPTIQTNAHLETLSSFPHLKALDLSSCLLVDDKIPYLSALKNLKRLNLSNNLKLTGNGCDQLPPSLEKLQLENCAITDSNCVYFNHLTNLQELNLSGNPLLTGAGFEYLSPSLLKLVVSDCAVVDENCVHLSHLKKLQTADLSGNYQLTGKGFKELPRSLVHFFASNCAVTDENRANLSNLTLLEELDLSKNRNLTENRLPGTG